MGSKYKYKLSIIVPVYNVELYLESCVDSIFQQEMNDDDFEVILVNDGSTDQSGIILKQLEKKYSNLIVIDQENGGMSNARNTGMSMAKGKYLLFLDSDDTLVPSTIKEVLDKTEGCHAEISICRMNIFDNVGSCKVSSDFTVFDQIVTGEEALLSGINLSSVCGNLYLRSFLLSHQLRFIEGITHEDVMFSLQATVWAKRLISYDNITYNYLWHDGSMNRNNNLSSLRKSLMSDLVIAHEEIKLSDNMQIGNFLRSYLRKKANSLIIANCIFLMRKWRITQYIRHDYVKEAKKLGVFPIHGHALSWKSTILSKFINLLLY